MFYFRPSHFIRFKDIFAYCIRELFMLQYSIIFGFEHGTPLLITECFVYLYFYIFLNSSESHRHKEIKVYNCRVYICI